MWFLPGVAEVPVLVDGCGRVVFQPAVGERGRAVERLGLVPGSLQPPS
jgi:hypothetical protein